MEKVLYGVESALDLPGTISGVSRWQEGIDRFLFNQSDGAMRVRFRADYEPGTSDVKEFLDKNLKWSAEAIEDMPRVGNPPWPEDETSAKGAGKQGSYPQIKYKRITQPHYRSVPTKNSEFGGKGLSVQLYDDDHEDIICEKGREFRVFFKRFERTNFGSGKVAHWYHFWSKEGGPGVCSFSRDDNDSSYAVYGGRKTVGGREVNGRYDPVDSKVILYDGAADGANHYKFPEENTPDNLSKDWVHYEFDAQRASDAVNITFAHERTHQLSIKKAGGWPLEVGRDGDEDGDGVPTDWEKSNIVPGMDSENPDSFLINRRQYFNASSGSDVPSDNEFYAWMCGAYMPDRVLPDGTTEVIGRITKNPPSAYHGVKPVLSNIQHDWSYNGYNWNLNQEE